jgi:hypothetical protein
MGVMEPRWILPVPFVVLIIVGLELIVPIIRFPPIIKMPAH